MGNLTDAARKGFNKRKKPWHDFAMPNSWPLWTVAAVVLFGGWMVYQVAFAGHPQAPAQEIAVPPPPPVTAPATAPPATVPPSAAPTPDGSGQGAAGERDFTASSPVQVPVTGTDRRAPVPQGALNVAKAAALATANGRWEGIPTAGTPAPPADPAPQAALAGDVSVMDPAITGDGTYVFTLTLDPDAAGGRMPYQTKVTVQRGRQGQQGYLALVS
ncbi:hypothetical protein [Bailinhaonella thermotolerans]|nr:hypothetical protein [Bailinhaonella thermotolerans]